MDDQTLLRTMLFDFFSDLLTEKQREYYDLYHNEDLSLSEISQRVGISKQGVYDIITRAEKVLEEIEDKTGVVQRWLKTREELGNARNIAESMLLAAGDNRELTILIGELVQSLEKAGN